jgi:hypothetical protein
MIHLPSARDLKVVIHMPSAVLIKICTWANKVKDGGRMCG